MSETISEFIKAADRTCPRVLGPFALLAKHGRDWTPAPLPADVRPGLRQACFHNCATIALRWRRYIYCEGYAAGTIPVLHAWLTDACGDGKVIDPTWTGGKNLAVLGHQYFGVAIKTEFLIHRLAERMKKAHRHNMNPLLDDWSNDYPISRARVTAWKHKLNTNHETT